MILHLVKYPDHRLSQVCESVDEFMTKMKEGCLSYPGRQVFVQRSATIRVRALNPAAEPIEFKASKMFARVIQHELDHLDGICKVAPK